MKNKDFKVAVGKDIPGMMQCGGCNRPILDRFLLNVLDRAWHIQCVQCSECGITLTEKCFSRDGQLFCKNDFFRRFGTKCAGCSLGISPSDLVRRARNKVFHLKCFTCMMCRKELSTGEELYILDENKFICKDDYISSKLSGSDIEDDGDFENVLENQDSISERDFSLDSDPLDNKPTLLQNAPPIPNNENTILNNHHPLLNKSDLSNSPGSPRHIKDEPMDHLSDSCPSPRSPDSQIISNINPGSNCSSMETNDNNNNKDGMENGKSGSKRRGPRTTIKAKQLEVLKASFNATPKPTRHIREQLAQETGLNMRVIQVWFQNRRSKERRMKQLSALGARRHFFRGPRRMRALRAGMSPTELEESELMGPGFGYYNDNGQDFVPGYQGYGEFYPGPVPEGYPMNFLPPSGRGTPPLGMEHPLSRVPMGPGPESQYLPPDMMPPSSSPEPLMPEDQYGMPQLPPRSLAGPYTSLPPNHPDVPSETW